MPLYRNSLFTVCGFFLVIFVLLAVRLTCIRTVCNHICWLLIKLDARSSRKEYDIKSGNYGPISLFALRSSQPCKTASPEGCPKNRSVSHKDKTPGQFSSLLGSERRPTWHPLKVSFDDKNVSRSFLLRFHFLLLLLLLSLLH